MSIPWSMQSKRIALGKFLKKKRDNISPAQIGLPKGARRRAPGLRREEVAQLAGLGVTWYTWLEQGRDINVSTQVLDRLAQVFMLSPEERKYIGALANRDAPVFQSTQSGWLDENLQIVLDSLAIPAHISDYTWNVLGWNAMTTKVFGDLSKKRPEERNFLWMLFTDPDYKQLIVNWEFYAREFVARFRAYYGQYGYEEDAFLELLRKLQEESEDFSRWWNEHDVRGMNKLSKVIMHPRAGEMQFECICMDVLWDTELVLVVHVPSRETNLVI